MGSRDFRWHNGLLQQAAKTVNKFESEQVQLRVIDALIATLQAPDEELDNEGPGDMPESEPALGAADQLSGQPAEG